MFRIGEFSKIAQVSARMLRHYDAIGLLSPARVDAGNGYRYYSARQLPTINRIVALRMLGLSLEEIGRIVAGGVTSAEIRAIYQARRNDIETLLEQEHRRLILVETRLHHLDAAGIIDLCASTLFEGGYGGLHLGYSALGAWIESNGYRIDGVGREIFWHLDRERPECNVTELQFPVVTGARDDGCASPACSSRLAARLAAEFAGVNDDPFHPSTIPPPP